MIITASLFALLTSALADALTGAPATPLFNGKDLTGWVNVNCDSDTFTVKQGDDGIPYILCSGVPTGVLRTTEMYENFTLEMEWMHQEEPGNAGLFVWSDGVPAKGVPFTRSVEVQIMLTPDVSDDKGRLLYTGQGDIFPIHGAVMTPDRPHPAGWSRCLPAARLTKGKGEWNRYRVTANHGRITLAVNGTEVSGGTNINPRKGFICLESEGTPIRFRNIQLTPLPDANPPLTPEQCALEQAGFTSLLHRGLPQWKEAKDLAGHWTLADGILTYDGKGGDLWSTESFGDFELIVDWRWHGQSQGTMMRQRIGPDGRDLTRADGKPELVEIDEWDSGIFLRGSSKSQVNMWNWPCGSGEVWGYRTDESMTPAVRAACTPSVRADAPIGSWNRFQIVMRGESLAVDLNAQAVIVNAILPGVPAVGPIAIQSHGSAVQCTNIFIRPISADR
ncbi:MAG: DUF1080 domain-containing protein [Phycisphaerales bacterium]|nr:DUF1080 domain-containing protein [Phycisphaerales bacterium]